MAVTVKFLADVVNWLAGLAASEGAVEDNEAALEDLMKQAIELGRQTGKTTDEIASDFSKAFGVPLDRAQRAVEEVTASTDDLGKSAEDAGDDVAKGIGDGAKDAGSSMSELGSIAKDVLSGDFGAAAESAVSSLAVLGPAGAAAGAVAATGIALITEAFKTAAAASDAARDSAYQYGLTVSASGSYADATGRLNELTGSIEGLQKVQDIATISGWKQKEVLTALATGDGLPALTKAFDEGVNSTTIATKRALELQGALEGTAQGFDLATDGATIQAQALYDLAAQAGVATGEVDELGNMIVKMPDGKEVVVNAETQTAYEDLDAIEKKRLSPKVVPITADTSAFNRSLSQLLRPSTKQVFVQQQMTNNLSPTGRFGGKQDT